MRTLKKIEETRKKALEIYFLKLKNEQKNEQKKQIVSYLLVSLHSILFFAERIDEIGAL